MIITKNNNWYTCKWGIYTGFGDTALKAVEDCLADYRHVEFLKTGKILSIHSRLAR